MADAAQPSLVAGKQGSGLPVEYSPRDTVGDLNSAGIKTGDFPGAFKIPGSKNVSLAIGGSVKTVAIADTNAEAMGADFTPAYLGTKRNDDDGAFSIDSSLTKLFLDGRAPAGDGQLRAYVEWDMNSANDGNLGVKDAPRLRKLEEQLWDTTCWPYLVDYDGFEDPA